MAEVEHWLTVSEAAARTGRCCGTIRQQFDAGRLAGGFDDHGYRRIDPDSLSAPPDGFSVAEAATKLSCSGKAIRQLFDAGVLAGHRDELGRRRINPASLDAIEVTPRPWI